MKTINNDLIRSFNPCYDPSEKKIPDGETLTVQEWVEKYRSVVPPQDIVWLLCRNHFLPDRDLRLFAVWCAREALGLLDSPDPRSVAACDVAERYANGEASLEELGAARDAAYSARDAAYAVATDASAYAPADAAAYATAAYYAATAAAARATVGAAAYTTARKKQIDKLLTYFK